MLALGIGAYALLQSLVIPVLTTVQQDLHTTQSAATWVLTAYLLSASIMTPILGRVGDMFGKERIFVASLVALAVGSLLAAVAPSIDALVGRMRVRREDHPLRAHVAAVQLHHVRGGHVRRSAHRQVRRQGARHRRVRDRGRIHGDPRLRARAVCPRSPVTRSASRS